MSLFNGICVKFLYRELKALEMALILDCTFGGGVEPSISKGFDGQASQKIRRYDDKKVSYLPLINLVPSPSWGANLRTDDAKLVRIARKLSKLEPKVLLRNFPSVEQIQDKVPETGWGAFRRVGRYNKNKSLQWKIENGKSLPSSSAPLSSSSAEGWRSSLLRKTSWVPEFRSRTTSVIHSNLTPHP